MRRTLIAAALAFSAGGQAFAADLPPAAPPPRAPATYVPVAAPVYNWGGIYIGVNGGYGFGDSNWTGASGGPTGSFDTDGALAGGTIGANFQTGPFVFGVEGDFDWSGLKGSSAGGCGTLAAPTSYSCQTSTDWLSTVRGRAGYAFDRVLVFGTGGGAFGDVIAGLSPGDSYPGAASTNSSTEFGWTAGAGIEFAFTDNLTAKIEYLYVDLSNGACTTACIGSTGPAPNVAVSFTESIVRAGINFKFGGF